MPLGCCNIQILHTLAIPWSTHRCVKLLAECCVGGDTELIVRASGYVSLPHAMAVVGGAVCSNMLSGHLPCAVPIDLGTLTDLSTEHAIGTLQLMMRPPTGASPTTVRYVSRAYWALLHHTYFATDTEHTKGQVGLHELLACDFVSSLHANTCPKAMCMVLSFSLFRRETGGAEFWPALLHLSDVCVGAQQPQAVAQPRGVHTGCKGSSHGRGRQRKHALWHGHLRRQYHVPLPWLPRESHKLAFARCMQS